MTYIEAVGFSWRHASRVRPAVDRLDLRIERGERVLLLGPSGGGKSTLLAALAGVLESSERGEASGQIRIDGVDSGARARPVGLLRQDPETSVVLGRVGDEVRFGCENLGVEVADTTTRARGALAAVGLDVADTHPTAELSGGQKQRLAFAALLAMRPELWLLDEPTAQLDPAGAQAIRDAVATELCPSDTLVLVEHQATEWWPLLTRVIAFNGLGQMVVDTTPERALGADRVQLEALGVWLPAPHIRPLASTHEPTIRLFSPDRLHVGRSQAIAGFDSAIRAGEALVLRGANGSGKSTLALTLGGLLPPHSGAVNANRNWAPTRSRRVNPGDPASWLSRDLANRIASVFQQPDLQFVRNSVRDEVRLGARSTLEADDLLERLGLASLAEAHPRSLSGGEKRRLSVATALASPAQLIIADEPTFGQDAQTWQLLTAELADARSAGRALVLPSHDTHLAQRIQANELTIEPVAKNEAAA